jgi:EmrB/QacA subfamily drug resistance transporter
VSVLVFIPEVSVSTSPLLDPTRTDELRPGADGATAELTPGRRRAVLAATCLALVLVVAGVSMLNLALPSIVGDLGASATEQHWIVDGYAVALAALLLPFGALGDRIGRRTTLLAGVAVFGLAAALSAFAGSPAQLIAWRVLSGAGAALIMPGTLATITSVFPTHERARAVGLWAGFAGAGGILGMLVSGALLESFWWGSVFLTSAALAVVAFSVAFAVVPDTRDPQHAHLDPLGSILSVLGIGGLVLGIIEGPSRGWTDPLTLAGLVVGVVSLVAWVGWSLRTPTPLLDMRSFRNRGFATGSGSLFVQFFGMFGLFLVALQFLLLVLGFGTLEAAVALLPMVLVILPLSAVAAPLAERLGQRVVGAAGLVITAAGFVLLAAMDTTSGYPHFLAGLIVVGVGMALAATPATNAIVGSLPPAKQGVASAVNDTARELGAAFGIAVLGSAFNSAYSDAISGSLTGLPTEAASVAGDSAAGAFAVAGQIGPAGAGLVNAASEAFMSAMQTSLVLGAVILLAGAVFVWLRAPRTAQVDVGLHLPARRHEPEALAFEVD